MKKQNNRVKIVVSSITTIFLVLLYCFIFAFSAQDGETSGSLSQMVAEEVVAFLDEVDKEQWTQLYMQQLAEDLEGFIRKAAHFCEYALMGALVFAIWYPWLMKFKYCTIVVIPWVFVSAAMDEIHQLFVPDRCGSIWDVLLDTSGGCAGLLFCILVVTLHGKWKQRKAKMKRGKKKHTKKKP